MKHTVIITLLSIDGIIVYDNKKSQNAPPQQLNKISAIVSFSRKRRTETSLPSKPLIPGKSSKHNYRKGGHRYMTLWDNNPDKIKEVVMETNLQTKSKRDRRFEMKTFEVVVGLKRGNFTTVLGVSILNVNGPTRIKEFKMPLVPMGMEDMKESNNDDQTVGVSSFIDTGGSGSPWEAEPIHFGDDFGRKFNIAKNASVRVKIEVVDTANYAKQELKKFPKISLNSRLPTVKQRDDEYHNISTHKSRGKPPLSSRPTTAPPMMHNQQYPQTMDYSIYSQSMVSNVTGRIDHDDEGLTIFNGDNDDPVVHDGQEYSVFDDNETSVGGADGNNYSVIGGGHDYSTYGGMDYSTAGGTNANKYSVVSGHGNQNETQYDDFTLSNEHEKEQDKMYMSKGHVDNYSQAYSATKSNNMHSMTHSNANDEYTIGVGVNGERVYDNSYGQGPNSLNRRSYVSDSNRERMNNPDERSFADNASQGVSQAASGFDSTFYEYDINHVNTRDMMSQFGGGFHFGGAVGPHDVEDKRPFTSPDSFPTGRNRSQSNQHESSRRTGQIEPLSQSRHQSRNRPPIQDRPQSKTRSRSRSQSRPQSRTKNHSKNEVDEKSPQNRSSSGRLGRSNSEPKMLQHNGNNSKPHNRQRSVSRSKQRSTSRSKERSRKENRRAPSDDQTEYAGESMEGEQRFYTKFMNGLFGASSFSAPDSAGSGSSSESESEDESDEETVATMPDHVQLSPSGTQTVGDITNYTQDSYMISLREENSKAEDEFLYSGHSRRRLPPEEEYRTIGKVESVRNRHRPKHTTKTRNKYGDSRHDQ